jgi:hypothetical protein
MICTAVWLLHKQRLAAAAAAKQQQQQQVPCQPLWMAACFHPTSPCCSPSQLPLLVLRLLRLRLLVVMVLQLLQLLVLWLLVLWLLVQLQVSGLLLRLHMQQQRRTVQMTAMTSATCV